MRATMALALSLLRERPGWRLSIWYESETELVRVRLDTGGVAWQAAHRLPYQAILNVIRRARNHD